MTEPRQAHPEEEILERYALGRLDEPELGVLEEHLLLCAHCQDRLDEATEYVSLLQEATAKLEAETPAEAGWKQWFRLDWLRVPTPALAGAFVVLLALLVWQPWYVKTPAEWQTVELATLRGGTEVTGAQAGYALRMRLDVTGLNTSGAEAQIVAASGAAVATAAITITDGKAELTYASGLQPGRYWVRLRKDGETVREYSLMVAPR